MTVYTGMDIEAIIDEWFRATPSRTRLGTLFSGIDDSIRTFMLSAGYTRPAAGAWPLIVDSELLVAKESTPGTYSVLGDSDVHDRGYFGSTAAAHLAGAGVDIALLSDCLGGRIYPGGITPPSYEGRNPALTWWYADDGRIQGDEGHKYDVRIGVKLYGGQERNGHFNPYAASLLRRLLELRVYADSPNEELASGVVLGVTAQFAGQREEPDTTPPWPFELVFLDMELRGKD